MFDFINLKTKASRERHLKKIKSVFITKGIKHKALSLKTGRELYELHKKVLTFPQDFYVCCFFGGGKASFYPVHFCSLVRDYWIRFNGKRLYLAYKTDNK